MDIGKDVLDEPIRTGSESWRTALSSAKGIYLITDSKGGWLYVGKADGEGGIWGRWSTYAVTGHGHNKGLAEELGTAVGTRQRDFRFSVLEIADLLSTSDEINAREAHWKRVLRSREFGCNRN